MSAGVNQIKEIFSKIKETGRTPFDLVSADGKFCESISEIHVSSLHNEILKTIQQTIVNTSHSNFWGVLQGEYGSGKTHLLQMLKLWARKNNVFFLWMEYYYGEFNIDAYLIRNLIDAMIFEKGFSQNDDSSYQPNVFQEVVFSTIKKAVLKILESGDPNWPEKLIRDQSILTKIFYNQDNQRRELLEYFKSPKNIPKILEYLDQNKILEVVKQEYRDQLSSEIIEPFSHLVRLAFTNDEDTMSQIFKQVLKIDDSDSFTEEKNYYINLTKAFCFLVAKGNIPICLVLDQFENTFNHLKKIYLDSEGSNDDLALVLNSIFKVFEKLFDEGEKRNFFLILTSQVEEWFSLQKLLADNINRRIQQKYILKTPNDEEIKMMIQKRLDHFGLQNGIPNFSTIFTFPPQILQKIIKTSNRRIGFLLPLLRKEFTKQISEKQNDIDIEQILNSHFVNIQNSLQSLVSIFQRDDLERDSVNYVRKAQLAISENLFHLQKLYPENGIKAVELSDEEKEKFPYFVKELLEEQNKVVEEKNLLCEEVQNLKQNCEQQQELLKTHQEQVQQKIDNKSKEIKKLKKELEKSTKKCNQLEDEIKRITTEIGSQEELKEFYENKIAQIQEENDKEKKEWERETQVLEKIIENNHNDIKNLTTKMNHLNENICTLEGQNATLNVENFSLSNTIEQLKKDVEIKDQEILEKEQEILELVQTIKDLPKGSPKDLPISPRDYKAWYRLFNTNSVKVVALHDYLKYFGYKISSMSKADATNIIIENFESKQIRKFLLTCYGRDNLKKLAKKCKVTQSGTMEDIMIRIFEAYDENENDE